MNKSCCWKKKKASWWELILLYHRDHVRKLGIISHIWLIVLFNKTDKCHAVSEMSHWGMSLLRYNLHAQCGEGEQQGVVRTTSLSELQYMSTLFGTVCRWHQSCHHKQTGSYEFYSVNLWQMKAEMETSVDYTCSRLSDYSVTLQNVSPSSQSVEIPY